MLHPTMEELIATKPQEEPTAPKSKRRRGDRIAAYDSLIQDAAQRYGVDPSLIKAVIRQESRGRHDATSPANAQGLMQLIPGTWKAMGGGDPFDPATNIDRGTKYLAQQLKQFGGDVRLALAAYNAGPGRVRQYKGIPPFKETQNYVASIMRMYERGGPVDAALRERARGGATMGARGGLETPPDMEQLIKIDPNQLPDIDELVKIDPSKVQLAPATPVAPVQATPTETPQQRQIRDALAKRARGGLSPSAPTVAPSAPVATPAPMPQVPGTLRDRERRMSAQPWTSNVGELRARERRMPDGRPLTAGAQVTPKPPVSKKLQQTTNPVARKVLERGQQPTGPVKGGLLGRAAERETLANRAAGNQPVPMTPEIQDQWARQGYGGNVFNPVTFDVIRKPNLLEQVQGMAASALIPVTQDTQRRVEQEYRSHEWGRGIPLSQDPERRKVQLDEISKLKPLVTRFTKEVIVPQAEKREAQLRELAIQAMQRHKGPLPQRPEDYFTDALVAAYEEQAPQWRRFALETKGLTPLQRQAIKNIAAWEETKLANFRRLSGAPISDASVWALSELIGGPVGRALVSKGVGTLKGKGATVAARALEVAGEGGGSGVIQQPLTRAVTDPKAKPQDYLLEAGLGAGFGILGGGLLGAAGGKFGQAIDARQARAAQAAPQTAPQPAPQATPTIRPEQPGTIPSDDPFAELRGMRFDEEPEVAPTPTIKPKTRNVTPAKPTEAPVAPTPTIKPKTKPAVAPKPAGEYEPMASPKKGATGFVLRDGQPVEVTVVTAHRNQTYTVQNAKGEKVQVAAGELLQPKAAKNAPVPKVVKVRDVLREQYPKAIERPTGEQIREWLAEHGEVASDTNRRLRYVYELDDGRRVSVEGVIRITKPAVWEQIKNRHANLRSAKARKDIYNALPESVRKDLLDLIPVEELGESAASKNVSAAETLVAWLRSNGHLLSETAHADLDAIEARVWAHKAAHERIRLTWEQKQGRLPKGSVIFTHPDGRWTIAAPGAPVGDVLESWGFRPDANAVPEAMPKSGTPGNATPQVDKPSTTAAAPDKPATQAAPAKSKPASGIDAWPLEQLADQAVKTKTPYLDVLDNWLKDNGITETFDRNAVEKRMLEEAEASASTRMPEAKRAKAVANGASIWEHPDGRTAVAQTESPDSDSPAAAGLRRRGFVPREELPPLKSSGGRQIRHNGDLTETTGKTDGDLEEIVFLEGRRRGEKVWIASEEANARREAERLERERQDRELHRTIAATNKAEREAYDAAKPGDVVVVQGQRTVKLAPEMEADLKEAQTRLADLIGQLKKARLAASKAKPATAERHRRAVAVLEEQVNAANERVVAAQQKIADFKKSALAKQAASEAASPDIALPPEMVQEAKDLLARHSAAMDAWTEAKTQFNKVKYRYNTPAYAKRSAEVDAAVAKVEAVLAEIEEFKKRKAEWIRKARATVKPSAAPEANPTATVPTPAKPGKLPWEMTEAELLDAYKKFITTGPDYERGVVSVMDDLIRAIRAGNAKLAEHWGAELLVRSGEWTPEQLGDYRLQREVEALIAETDDYKQTKWENSGWSSSHPIVSRFRHPDGRTAVINREHPTAAVLRDMGFVDEGPPAQTRDGRPLGEAQKSPVVAPESGAPTAAPESGAPTAAPESPAPADAVTFTRYSPTKPVERWTAKDVDLAIKEATAMRDLAEAGKNAKEVADWDADIAALKGLQNKLAGGKKRAPRTPRPEATVADVTAPEPAPDVAPVRRGPVNIPAREPIQVKATGKTERITTPGHEMEVDVEYALVPQSSLVTSHTDTFGTNPDYPKDLQPRFDRGETISRAQTLGIATSPRPASLADNPFSSHGAPVVGPDGYVESGNSRTIALRIAGADKRAKYTQWLKDNAARFGLNPDDVTDDTILVRVRKTEMTPEERVRFAELSNREGVSSFSGEEEAFVDSGVVDDALLRDLSPAPLDSAANRTFIDNFLNKLPRTAQAALRNPRTMKPTAEGLRRAKAALFAYAYGKGDVLRGFVESGDNVLQSMMRALDNATPQMAKLRSEIQSGVVDAAYDIADDLTTAFNTLVHIRKNKLPLETYLNNTQLEGAPTLTDFQKTLVRAMAANARTHNKFARAVTSYADAAPRTAATSSLFDDDLGVPTKTKAQVWDDAVKRAEGVVEDEFGEPVLQQPGNEHIGAMGRALHKMRAQGDVTKDAFVTAVRSNLGEAAAKFAATRWDEIERAAGAMGGQRVERMVSRVNDQDSLAEALRRVWGLDEESAQNIAAVAQARAATWASWTGRSEAEWYQTRLHSVTSGPSNPDALRQPGLFGDEDVVQTPAQALRNAITKLGDKATEQSVMKQVTQQGVSLRDAAQELQRMAKAGEVSREPNGVYRVGKLAKAAEGELELRSPDNAFGQGTLFQDAKAEIEFLDDGTAILRALTNPDPSSGVHELAHLFRRDLYRSVNEVVDAARRSQIAADIKAMEDWIGETGARWTVDAEEKFARGFERYVADGTAPSKPLERVFKALSKWMKNIYGKIQGSEIDVDVPPAMREVFDRLLADTKPKAVPEATPGATGQPRTRKAATGGTPPPASTAPTPGQPASAPIGIANRLEEPYIEAGVYQKPASGVIHDKLALQDWANGEAKRIGIPNILALGRKIATDGHPPSKDAVALANSGLKMLMDEADRLRKVYDADETEFNFQEVQRAQRELQEFVDNVQKGKTEWHNTGMQMQVAVDQWTGSPSMALAKAKGNLKPGQTLPKRTEETIVADATRVQEIDTELRRLERQAADEEAQALIDEQVAAATGEGTATAAEAASPGLLRKMREYAEQQVQAMGIPALVKKIKGARILRQGGGTPYDPAVLKNAAGRLADSLVEQFARAKTHVKLEDVTAEVQKRLNAQGIDITHDQVVDDYLHVRRQKAPTRTHLQQQRRNLYRQAAEQEKLRRELATGSPKQRKPPLPHEQRTRELQQLAKDQRHATRVAEALKVVQDRIAAIRAGKPDPVTSTRKPANIPQALADARKELRRLKAEQAKLANAPAAARKKADADIARLEQQIKDLQAGTYRPNRPASPKPADPRVAQLQAQRDAMMRQRAAAIRNQRELDKVLKQIAELEAGTYKPPQPGAKPAVSPALEAARKKRDALMKQASEPARIAAQIKAIEDRIAQMQAGTYQPKTRGPVDPRIADLLRKEAALRRQLYPSGRAATIEQRKASVRARIAALQQQIATGNVSTRSATPSATDAELDNLLREYEALRTEARLMREIAEIDRKLKTKDYSTRQPKPAPTNARIEQLRNEKGMLQRKLRARIDSLKPMTKGQLAMEVWLGLTRTLNFSMDAGVIGRQGLILNLSSPVTAIRSLKQLLKGGLTEEGYQEVLRLQESSPYFQDAIKSNLYLADLSSGREEEFIGHGLIDRARAGLRETKQTSGGLKRFGAAAAELSLGGYRGSERLHNAYLNQIRLSKFSQMAKWIDAFYNNPVVAKMGNSKVGKAIVGTREDQLKAAAEYINIASGRGSLGPLDKHTAFPAAFLTSPRFYASRIQWLLGWNVAAKGSVAARAMIATEYIRTIAMWAGLVQMAKLMAGKDEEGKDRFKVTLDPRNPDFAKGVLGDTRLDITAGLGGYVSLLGRLWTGEEKFSDEEKPSKIRGVREYGMVMDFLRGKLNPGMQVPVNAFVFKNTLARDPDGRKLPYGPMVDSETKQVYDPNWWKNIPADLLAPLSIRELLEAANKEGWDSEDALALLNLVGLSASRYADARPPKWPALDLKPKPNARAQTNSYTRIEEELAKLRGR